jgi:hypothetical protein
MVNLGLQTLVTHVAPSGSIFSVLAALDVLQNAVSVSVPFYRTLLFRLLSPSSEENLDEPKQRAMVGDPDPILWVKASSIHWFLVGGIMSFLLLFSFDGQRIDETQTNKRKGR